MPAGQPQAVEQTCVQKPVPPREQMACAQVIGGIAVLSQSEPGAPAPYERSHAPTVVRIAGGSTSCTYGWQSWPDGHSLSQSHASRQRGTYPRPPQPGKPTRTQRYPAVQSASLAQTSVQIRVEKQSSEA